MRVFLRGIVAFAQIKRPESSASAADDMTFLIIWTIVRMGPLREGTWLFSESIMCAPARLRARGTLRYVASEWAERIMALDM